MFEKTNCTTIIKPRSFDDVQIDNLQTRARVLAEEVDSNPIDAEMKESFMSFYLYENYENEPLKGEVMFSFPPSVEKRKYMLTAELRTLLLRNPTQEDGLFPVMAGFLHELPSGTPELLIDKETLEAFVLATSDIDYVADSKTLPGNQFFLRAAQRKSGMLPFALLPVYIGNNAYQLFAIEQPNALFKQATLSRPILVGQDFSYTDLANDFAEALLYDVVENKKNFAIPFDTFCENFKKYVEDPEHAILIDYIGTKRKKSSKKTTKAKPTLADYAIEIPYKGVKACVPLTIAIELLRYSQDSSDDKDEVVEQPLCVFLEPSNNIWTVGYKRMDTGRVPKKFVGTAAKETFESGQNVRLYRDQKLIKLTVPKNVSKITYSTLVRKGNIPHELTKTVGSVEIEECIAQAKLLERLIDKARGNKSTKKSKALTKLLKKQLDNTLSWRKLLEDSSVVKA